MANNSLLLNLFLCKSVKLLTLELLILAQMCTKSFVGRASPQTPLGSLQLSPDPLAALRGLLLRGGEEEGRGGEVRGEGKGGEGRERRGQPPPRILGLEPPLVVERDAVGAEIERG